MHDEDLHEPKGGALSRLTREQNVGHDAADSLIASAGSFSGNLLPLAVSISPASG